MCLIAKPEIFLSIRRIEKLEFGEKEEKDYMGSIAALFMYLMIIGFIAVVAYFVIKKAIEDALKEYHNENNK